MTLELDERRTAMLAEFGIRVFRPEPQSVAAHVQPSERASVPSAERTPAAAPVDIPQAAPVAPSARPSASDIDNMDWDALSIAVAECGACKLCSGRRNAVFGVGDQRADWLIVGEAPHEDEDLQGQPFVGQAGELLDNMLRAIGKDRNGGVYLTSVIKCRPPGNRNPEPEEIAQCQPFLRRQVELLQPRIILAMGRFAVQALLNSTEPIGKLRGRVHHYNGVPVVVTLHPAQLLRNLPEKSKAWSDLCLAMAVVEGGIPAVPADSQS